MLLVRKGNKFGVIYPSGTIILPTEYDQILVPYGDRILLDIEVVENGVYKTIHLHDVCPSIPDTHYVAPEGGFEISDNYYNDDLYEDYETRQERMYDAYISGEGTSDDYDI